MRNLKTNVTISFNSIEEIKEGKLKLEQLGYKYDNDSLLFDENPDHSEYCWIKIYSDKSFLLLNFTPIQDFGFTYYESFTEFENSLNH